MEIFELKYFLAAADTENIHRASEKINVSPPAISKAISRLEDELGIPLFGRAGRNIQLTSYGRLLQKRASKIIHLEESARMEIGSHEGQLQVAIAGHEALISNFGVSIGAKLREIYPKANLAYIESFDKATLQKIENGEAHFGFVTCDVPTAFFRKKVGEANFQTVVSRNHKLYKKAKGGGIIPVEELLEYPFVSPKKPILGKVSDKQSSDGWRDDKFPRKIEWSTSSLATLMQIVDQGEAIAYLPDYLVEKQGWSVLQVSGCPYSCQQKVYLVARKLDQLSWLRRVLQDIS